jgi:O-antigen/teichoic acid export membrane protein
MNIHNSEILKGTVAALILKAGGAVFQFIMTVIIARQLGAADTGVFLLSLTIVTVLSVFSRFGTDNYLVKIISQHSSKQSLSTGIAYLEKVILSVFVFSFIVSVIVYFIAPLISEYIFDNIKLGRVLAKMSAVVWLLSFMLTISFALQGFKKIIAAVSVQNLIVPLLSTLVLLYLSDQGIESPIYAYYAALLSSSMLGVFILVKTAKKYKSDLKNKLVTWSSIWQETKPYYFVSILNQIIAWVPLFIAGAYITEVDLGIYQASIRTSLLISFVLMASNSIIGPKIAEFYANRDLILLKKTTEGFTFLLLVTSLPVILVFIIFSENILVIFGEEFIQGSNVLRILVIGQLVNVFFGPVMLTLMMTSHANAAKKVLKWTSVVMISLSALLIPEYGMVGAAIASSVGMVFQNVVTALMVKKHIGHFPVPDASMALGAYRYFIKK